MPIGLYLDAGLTQPAAAIAATQTSDGTAAAVDRAYYLGSPVAGKQFQSASAPGADPIVLSLTDAASGSGVEAAHLRLATSQAGLAAATPGAALSLSHTLLSGVANAVAVWVRIDTPALADGAYEDVSFHTNSLVETNV